MSLKLEAISPVADGTARVAHAAFPQGNIYRQMRDLFGTLYDDARFAPRFAVRGRPAETPWPLALVTVMQFAEGLADRQAAEAVRARIAWKNALGLELTDAGVDFSVLCAFRARLGDGGAEQLLLDALLTQCTARGSLRTGGQQRTVRPMCLGRCACSAAWKVCARRCGPRSLPSRSPLPTGCGHTLAGIGSRAPAAGSRSTACPRGRRRARPMARWLGQTASRS